MGELTAGAVLADARAILGSAPLGWLMTTGSDGRVDARVMQPFAPDHDLTLWFGTSPASRKIADLGRLPLATAGFQSADGAGYVSLSGPATIVDDLHARQQRWRDDWSRYFPGGPRDGYVLVRLDPDRVEVLDFAHDIAPEPFGAVAATVVRIAGSWRLVPGGPAE